MNKCITLYTPEIYMTSNVTKIYLMKMYYNCNNIIGIVCVRRKPVRLKSFSDEFPSRYPVFLVAKIDKKTSGLESP